jgi:hypothetical protein
MHSGRMLREGARRKAGDCPGILGHVYIDVTQNVYGKAGGKCEWRRSPKLSKP